jgi:hypothetical protein
MAVNPFKEAFDLQQNYFYKAYGPISKDLRRFHFVYIKDGDYYYQRRTGTKWKHDAWLFYDFRGEAVAGFERLPELPFDSLLQLVFLSDYKSFRIWPLSVWEMESNQYGAASIIMDRFHVELIDFLNDHIANKEFSDNALYKRNLRLFADLFNRFDQLSFQYPKWQRIAQRVRTMITVDR